MSFRHFSADSVPNQGYITYNAYSWNSPVSITYPGGTKKEYTYDPLMRMEAITAKDPGQNQFMNYNYQYAPAGNITAKNTEHGNYAYQYDDLYRLTNADNATVQDEAYAYDAVSNRLTSANVTGAWSYNQNNELLNYDGVSNEYDNNGNTISKTDNCGTTTYQYDAENRLIGINGFSPNCQPLTATYYYDPFGRRLWKDVSGNRTYFLYVDEGLIGEYDTSGSEIKTYGYEPNSTWTTNPLFQKIGTNYYWYQNDHLGTPQKLIDTSGRVVWSATYDSFGNIQIDVAEIENNLRFPGQYYDAETGLHYNYYRDYDPEIGRYIEADVIGIVRGNNHLYVYVKNIPSMKSDPMGLYPGPCGNENNTWVPDYPFYVFDFTGPCQAHDNCYGCEGKKAVKSKAQCDLKFLWNMTKTCFAYPPSMFSLCSAAATIYYVAVSTGGSDSFNDARKKCCSKQLENTTFKRGF